MSKKTLVITAIVAVVGLFAGGTYFYRSQQATAMQFKASQSFEVFVRDHSPKKGDKDAKVFVVEFLDPECEACRMMAPYVSELLNYYSGKIQVVVRYAPFHGNSKFAVKLLEASRKQGKYWEVLDVMFKYQPMWGNHHNPQPELLWQYLPEAGVDVEQVKKDMEDPMIEKIIEQDIADLQELGVRRTPSFFVNGKPLQQFGPQYLRELIDAEIKATY